jgi:hypothetical protein
MKLVSLSISYFKNYCPLLTSYYTLKLVEKSAFLLLKYRYLPVFGIGHFGITVFEKVGIFAIP